MKKPASVFDPIEVEGSFSDPTMFGKYERKNVPTP